ncbi:MAG TPA: cytochrome ubiquinol oxidase subunit I, partial [Albitalea sp.]|nr:cytochrome ubiquinol oxidase subunit I [Albitalea sp.]
VAIAEVGAGVHLPVGATGRRSHSWWACVVLLVVDATVLAAMAFAHVHVALRAYICPPPGAALPSMGAMTAVAAGWAASSLLLWLGMRRLEAPPGGWRCVAVIAAAALAVGAFAALLLAHRDSGLVPQAQAWSATVAALLAYQGLHALLIVVLAAYLVARAASGLLLPRQRATLDNIALLWHGGCAQGVVMAWLPLAVTGWLAR